MARSKHLKTGLLLLVGLLVADDAAALFLPRLPAPPIDDGLTVDEKAAPKSDWIPSLDLAVNADARATWEDVVAKPQGGGDAQEGEIELQTYGVRVEWLPYHGLSIQALLGHNTGTSGPFDLTGRIAGAGFTAAYADNPFSQDPSFALFGTLNGVYTNSDFRDVKNTINTWSATLRLGAIKRVGNWLGSFYAGPSFQDFTRYQTTSLAPLGGTGYQTFEVRPKSRWNGVIGASIGIGGCHEAVVAPLSFAVEGGIGDRRYVSGNLRYQWGVDDCTTFALF